MRKTRKTRTTRPKSIGFGVRCLVSGVAVAIGVWNLSAAVETAQDELSLLQLALGADAQGFFGPLTLPTEPIAVARPAAEWDRAAALFLNVSLELCLADPRILAFYEEYIATASRYAPVIVGHDVAEIDRLEWFTSKVGESLPDGDALDRIQFLATNTESFWARDFAPVFVWATDGELVAVDSIYRRPIMELAAFAGVGQNIESKDRQRSVAKFFSFVKESRRSDIAPLALARWIRGSLGQPCDTVRPELYLQGGDYITDGRSRVFISTDTVIENGGDRKRIAKILEEYYGASEVHFLEALPGEMARHLDLSIKLLSPNVMLMARPPELRPNSSMYSNYLVRRARESFEFNYRYLRRFLPDIEILEVPTPPLVEDSEESIFLSVQAQLVAKVCEELEINFDRYWRASKTDLFFTKSSIAIGARMQEVAGRPLNLAVKEDLNLLLNHYYGSTIDELKRTYVSSVTAYRSYANSQIICSKEGDMAIFAPRYLPREGEDPERFAQMEREVEWAYRSVYPNADVHWIVSDVMAERLGALHCVSATIPHAYSETQ